MVDVLSALLKMDNNDYAYFMTDSPLLLFTTSFNPVWVFMKRSWVTYSLQVIKLAFFSFHVVLLPNQKQD
jgi:hypothetical protein